MTLILQGTDNSVSSPAVQGGTAGTTTGIYYPTGNTLAISTNGTLVATADSAQRFLVGSSAPVWDERLSSRLSATGSGQTGLGVYSASTSYATSLLRVQAENPTGAAWNILDGRGQGGGIKILIDGNGLINLYSGQIQFPATQNPSSDANTLDDYEEGTWTASYNNGTITSQSCQYTKIGRCVTATFGIQFTSSSTSLGTISGLPFSVSGCNYVGTHSREWYNTGNTTQCITTIGATAFALFFYNNTVGVTNGSIYGVSGTLVYNN